VPRSGSTALQYYLAGSIEGAVTCPETWIIPFAMAARDPLAFSPVGLVSARLAEQQLFDGAYNEALFKGVRSFFDSKCREVNGKFFIEKTPRNILYGNEILENMPEAKILVLVRHPVDICLSVFENFCKNRPNLSKSAIDLCTSFDNLIKLIDNERTLIILYEKIDNKDYLINKLSEIGYKYEHMRKKSMYLNTSFMGDKKFKADDKIKTNKFRYKTEKISLIKYLIIRRLLNQKSWIKIINNFYDENSEIILRDIRSNIYCFGILDLLFFIGGYVSAVMNLKCLYEKFKTQKLFSYLR
jgi:hypothetical protein